MPIPSATHPASYRDPAGFIFIRDGIVYRQINRVFQPDFDQFVQSGCYQHLVDRDLLISHINVDESIFNDPNWFKTIQPEQVRFVSYPSEWPFDMLKDAALLTLQLAKQAIGFNMILKDATPYNVQWHNGKLKFIDSLSFERYNISSFSSSFCE